MGEGGWALPRKKKSATSVDTHTLLHEMPVGWPQVGQGGLFLHVHVYMYVPACLRRGGTALRMESEGKWEEEAHTQRNQLCIKCPPC